MEAPIWKRILVLFSLIIQCEGHANPQEPTVEFGQAHLTAMSPSVLQIETSEKALINWESFSIGEGEKVHFIQPNMNSLVVNQVTGSDPSHILGTLSATAKLYLINPNGIMIGENAVIDAASFAASTHPFDFHKFIDGEPAVFKGESEAKITHQGTIKASTGNIIFVARKIENEGKIFAPKGTFAIGAGYEVILRPTKNALLHIRTKIDPSRKRSEVVAGGVIEALKTEIQSESSAFQLAVHKDPDALDLVIEEEGIYLRSSKVEINGSITSDKIWVQGDEISVSRKASLYANTNSILEAGRLLSNQGKIHSKMGEISVKVASEEGVLYQLSEVAVKGDELGKVLYQAETIYHSGVTEAPYIAFQVKDYIDTASSLVKTKENGFIVWKSHLPQSRFFSSGNIVSPGGEVQVLLDEIRLAGSHVTVSHNKQAGKIFLGDLKGNNPKCSHLFLNWASELQASGQEKGQGGEIYLYSSNFLENAGHLCAKGGVVSGDGGTIELSSLCELNHVGLVEVEAYNGQNGRLIFDPKNIIISNEQNQRYPQFEIIEPCPQKGAEFGGEIHSLDNGNIVITSSKVKQGTVYLFNGFTGQLIGATFGKGAGVSSNRVGKGGITPLSSGDYVISSPDWFNGRGAVTLVDAKTGHPKQEGFCFVCPQNSLVGTNSGVTQGDFISSGGIVEVSESTFAVLSPLWSKSENRSRLGAVTLLNQQGQDILGNSSYLTVHENNSVHGLQSGDQIGSHGIYPINEKYFAIVSPLWSYKNQKEAGAVTLVNSFTGTDLLSKMVVHESNSLHGKAESDQVGIGGVVPLCKDRFVVVSPHWSFQGKPRAGAVTLLDSNTGKEMRLFGAGPGVSVNAGNSLHGSHAMDLVGSGGITVLENKNFIVSSPLWNHGEIKEAGAITVVNGQTGTDLNWLSYKAGMEVSPLNSLCGKNAGDKVGSDGIFLLGKNYFAVASGNCQVQDVKKAGAITLMEGDYGRTLLGSKEGPGLFVSYENSIHGTSENDQVGRSLTKPILALNNGNFVGLCPYFQKCKGASFFFNFKHLQLQKKDQLFSGFSLDERTTFQGEFEGDYTGFSALDLKNQNYALLNPYWNQAKGAVTFFSAEDGSLVNGEEDVITPSNSFIGRMPGHKTGKVGYVLDNHHLIISSPGIKAKNQEGALTLLDGATGYALKNQGAFPCFKNSLYGIKVDQFSEVSSNVIALENRMILSQPFEKLKDNSKVSVITLFDAETGVSGFVNPFNSIFVKDESCFAKQVIMKKDVFNGSFVLGFPGEHYSEGRVRVGITNPNCISFTHGASKTLQITPKFIEDTLATGTDITLQANNDIYIASPLAFKQISPKTGELTLRAGRSVYFHRDLKMGPHSLRVIGNDYLISGVQDPHRDPGKAMVVFSPGTRLSSEGGDISLELISGKGKTHYESGCLYLGPNTCLSTLQGSIKLIAEDNTIMIKEGTKLFAENGNILVSGGMHVHAMENSEISTKGKGNISIIVDQLHPFTPLKGKGRADLLHLDLHSQGTVHIYAVSNTLTCLPKVMNGSVYSPSMHGTNSSYEKWGSYYPQEWGIYPFAIFYKEGAQKEVFLFSTPYGAASSLPMMMNHVFPVHGASSEAFDKWGAKKDYNPRHFNFENHKLPEVYSVEPSLEENDK